MILLDNIGHLVSTVSEDELHIFASKLGLKRKWYQDLRHPHYDLTTPRMKHKALNMGAELATASEIVMRAWWK